MRKIVLMMISVALIFLSGVYASASEYKETVSVGIKYGANSGSSVTVSSSDGLNIYDDVSKTLIYTAQPLEDVYIEMGSTGFASWNKFDAGAYSKLSIQPISGGTIFCDGTQYRGHIYIERRINGELLVINYVGIDEYVSSVLGKEMSYTWPKEALKAQAVCARNFVLTRGSFHKSDGFNV